MRRKGKKVQVITEVKTESPKRTRQSSGRRKRSSSKSGDENETQREDSWQNQSNVELEEDKVNSGITDSGNNLVIDTENNSQVVEDSTTSTENIAIQEENDDKDEENTQGKSTGINYTNNDQTSNNIEPENENVQGSTPSPNDNDEKEQITMENETKNVPNYKNPEAIKKNYNKNIEETNDTEDIKNIEETSNDKEQCTFQSEYVNEESQDNGQETRNGEVKNDQHRSTTPEIKPPERKRITLKRSPIQKGRPSSPLEDGEIQEQKVKTRKITLKRPTFEEHNPEFDKIVINRRPSTGEKKEERRKRLSSVTEENTLTVVGKPNKPAKTVKLVRNFSTESQETEASQRVQKHSWGKSKFLDNLSANTLKIDVDSIKGICPSVEFLKESEVKLEEVPKIPIKSESDSGKKATDEEEEEKSDEESEKEQTEGEESSEEPPQKFEANPNIIALNRKISIVEDTAAKMRTPASPAKNPPTEIIYITNLVRPFTVKQLKELLERTGKIRENGFWTDRIKSKCYAYFESLEEAEMTRNALHGINWPIGNGKQLVIDYATEEDMEAARNPVPLPVPITQKLPDKENREPVLLENRNRGRELERNHDREERKRDVLVREWDKSREDHRRKHSKSRSRSRERVRKHTRKSYTPEDHTRKKHKTQDDSVPQKLMDDLFLKTKAMPSIYWQPLSPQEIATKQQQRLVRMEEHKRRIQENTRGRRDRDRRGSFRRR